MDKPSISTVLADYIELRRAGNELKAHCPFHEDKSPSFFVNEDRGVFYCFGCGVSGDVFDFLMKWSGKTFKEVCNHLGLHGLERRIVPDDTRVAAEKIRLWIIEFSLAVSERMRDIGEDSRIAWMAIKDGIGDPKLMRELIAELNTEWHILEVLHEDLVNPEYILGLYAQREDLERLVSDG